MHHFRGNEWQKFLPRIFLPQIFLLQKNPFLKVIQFLRVVCYDILNKPCRVKFAKLSLYSSDYIIIEVEYYLQLSVLYRTRIY